MEAKPARQSTRWSKLRLVWVSILGGVALAVIGFSSKRREVDHATARAKVQIELLSVGIEKYKLDHGQYPGVAQDSPLEGDISEELYIALFYEGWNSQNHGDGSIPIYLSELDPTRETSGLVKKVSGGVAPPNLMVIDPWGRPYRYRKGAHANNPDYDLWSTGRDGVTNLFNSGVDVAENRDDVRNF